MDWPPRRRRPWAALAAGVAAFLASGLALLWCAEGARPELGDPEYGRKLARLRARRAGRPGRLLVLALGSSRVAMGLRPGLLRASAGDPLVFNFGILQSFFPPRKSRALYTRAVAASSLGGLGLRRNR